MNMTVCMEASKEYFINYITTMDFDMGKLCLPFVQTYGFIETSGPSKESINTVCMGRILSPKIGQFVLCIIN